MDIDLYKDSEKIIELKYDDIELKKNKFIIKKNLDTNYDKFLFTRLPTL